MIRNAVFQRVATPVNTKLTSPGKYHVMDLKMNKIPVFFTLVDKKSKLTDLSQWSIVQEAETGRF